MMPTFPYSGRVHTCDCLNYHPRPMKDWHLQLSPESFRLCFDDSLHPLYQSKNFPAYGLLATYAYVILLVV